MGKILESLYYGELQPYLKTDTDDSTYTETVESQGEIERQLLEILDESQKALFREFIEVTDIIQEQEKLKKFICGFKLGAKLLLEATDEKSPCMMPKYEEI